jgi:RNA polymerase sigma-70 factor (ECF subfamily)
VIDATTLAEIWDAHADRLVLIARSIGGPAEDAVQEAFIALAGQSELPRDPLAWLVRVTRNQLLQNHRRNRRRRTRESVACDPPWFDCEILSVDRRLDAREVTAALLAISSPAREVIVMHLWGEMTFESIAEVIGVSRASAHRAFVGGIETLKREFKTESEADSMRLYHERK